MTHRRGIAWRRSAVAWQSDECPGKAEDRHRRAMQGQRTVWRRYGYDEHRQALQRHSIAWDCIAKARQGEAEHRIPTKRKGKEEPGPAKAPHGKVRLSNGKAAPSIAMAKQAGGEQS